MRTFLPSKTTTPARWPLQIEKRQSNPWKSAKSAEFHMRHAYLCNMRFYDQINCDDKIALRVFAQCNICVFFCCFGVTGMVIVAGASLDGLRQQCCRCRSNRVSKAARPIRLETKDYQRKLFIFAGEYAKTQANMGVLKWLGGT